MTHKNLTSQDIYQKNFRTSMRGYKATEVDEFLDLILQDYDTYEKEIASLKAENVALLRRLENEEKQHSFSDQTIVAKSSTQMNGTNYDILKRISNLEKHVFGAKLDNN
ncbi:MULTISPECIES: cell division regulator GpsB [unclassified Granulicatella]|uniref:cell division regulator GpsB n=1 Tax=unclassified Granulicatella TaxID=2630493 RepID=UPI00107430DD|nr:MULTISPECIES: cell division regulator GpsB [unclassified Granulicatella]MBF0779592.1 cell division regulator GpsB [Granulicatella sp. 19428wC4_WM01]TFU96393.1 cell division regulator GpsB [Granulicatella sp. WM01]